MPKKKQWILVVALIAMGFTAGFIYLHYLSPKARCDDANWKIMPQEIRDAVMELGALLDSSRCNLHCQSDTCSTSIVPRLPYYERHAKPGPYLSKNIPRIEALEAKVNAWLSAARPEICWDHRIFPWQKAGGPRWTLQMPEVVEPCGQNR